MAQRYGHRRFPEGRNFEREWRRHEIELISSLIAPVFASGVI
jgi:hypothetical protein